MALYRPYIPLKVRAAVIRRMLHEKADWGAEQKEDAIWLFGHLGSDAMRIEIGLSLLGLPDAQLDHDPALEQRKKRRHADGTITYSPPANSPDHLIYRTKEDHLQKTTGRKPGAEKTVTTKGSDAGIAKKFRRLEGKTKRRKQKIPSRPFPKGMRGFRGKR